MEQSVFGPSEPANPMTLGLNIIWQLNDFFHLKSKYLEITTLVHGNKVKLQRPSLALFRCKSNIQIF